MQITIPTSCCTTQVKIACRLIWASHTGHADTLCLISMVTRKDPCECFWCIYAGLCGCSHWLSSFSVDIALAWPLWGSVGTHAVFSPCSLLFPGDIEVDFPMPGVPSGPVPWWLSLSRAAQVYQLLCQGVRLYAPLVHTVQGRLCALQDPPAPRQDQVLQVHLGPCQFWRDDEWVERGESLHGSQALKDLGDICGAGLRPFAGEGSRKSGSGSCLYLEVSHTGPSILVSRLRAAARGTDWCEHRGLWDSGESLVHKPRTAGSWFLNSVTTVII